MGGEAGDSRAPGITRSHCIKTNNWLALGSANCVFRGLKGKKKPPGRVAKREDRSGEGTGRESPDPVVIGVIKVAAATSSGVMKSLLDGRDCPPAWPDREINSGYPGDRQHPHQLKAAACAPPYAADSPATTPALDPATPCCRTRASWPVASASGSADRGCSA